jgi:hypothetical protein
VVGPALEQVGSAPPCCGRQPNCRAERHLTPPQPDILDQGPGGDDAVPERATPHQRQDVVATRVTFLMLDQPAERHVGATRLKAGDDVKNIHHQSPTGAFPTAAALIPLARTVQAEVCCLRQRRLCATLASTRGRRDSYQEMLMSMPYSMNNSGRSSVV